MITQNAIHMLRSVTNIQMNSFVITTEDGKLILIDGGQKANAEYLLSYLRELSGQDVPYVDAWFLTHAHSDHVDAFLEIVKNHQSSLRIGKVLMNMQSEQFYLSPPTPDKSAANTVRELYDALPFYADKLCVCSEGDIYNIGCAHIDILYSSDPSILSNVCNNTSLVFKLTLGKKTALFLGDCGIEAGNKILKKYDNTDVLKCNICQMAHHGQNGVSRELYEAVRPEICLWCTPDWLWNNDVGQGFNTHIFKTVEVRSWMEELGTVRKNLVMMDGTQVLTMQ